MVLQLLNPLIVHSVGLHAAGLDDIEGVPLRCFVAMESLETEQRAKQVLHAGP